MAEKAFNFEETKADYDDEKVPRSHSVPVYDKDGPVEFAEKADLR